MEILQRALINPQSFDRRGLKIPNKADPIQRRDLVYYSDPKHRGYLAVEGGKVAGAAAVVEEVAPQEQA